MSARTRLPRQAAQAAKYTFDEPSDDEPEDPRGGISSDEDARPAKKRKKGKAKAAGKKGRRDPKEDEEEGQDSTTKHIRVPSPPPQDVEYESKRVDFSKVLPVETIAEIFSYLQPRTLYRLAFLNRSFHTMLSSPGFRSTWRDIFTWHDPRMDWMDDVFFGFDEEEQPEQKKAKPKPRDKMPVFGGKEIDPYRLAILLYETTCEFCGEDTVKYPDTFFLLRLCAYCRRNNLVSSTALAESKKYDMHPATMRAVLASPFGIDELKKYSYERNVLVTHFYQTIDELEERQAEDDADQQTANAQLGTHATGRNPSRAAKVKASSRARAQLDDDDAAEDERNGPRVAAFLKARAKERDARHTFVNAVDELAVKIDRFCEDEVVESRLFSMQAKSMRLEGIRQRLADEAIFEPRHINDIRLERHPAVSKDEPLNDHIWAAISESVYADVGRGVAKHLVWKYENKRKEVDWHAAKTSVDLLKQPSSVSDAGWAYVESAMKQLIRAKKDESDRLKARQRDAEDLAQKQQVVDKKNAFFRERYDKICRMLPNSGARAYMPRFLEFLHLPTANDLYADDVYGVDTKRGEADVQRFTNHLDAIKAELDEFALELRLAGLKVILASTTEMTSKDIEDLEVDTLADPQYGDEFFERPSSWLFCGDCIVFGTLSALLQHIHKKHPRNPPPLRLDDETGDAAQRKPPTKPLVRLPLEVACAWSAIFELGKLDIEDPKVTAKDLDRAFDEYKLVWENGPRGSKGRSGWRELIKSVMRNTLLAEMKGEVLDPPVIALKDVTPRERRLAEEARKAAVLARMAKKLKREGKKKAAEPSAAKVKVEKVESEDEDERKLERAVEDDGGSKAQADLNEEEAMKEEDKAGADEESEPDEVEQGGAGDGSEAEQHEDEEQNGEEGEE
uniref:BY PROTMAP: gi/647400300/emb/CDR45650.1/ RHTO0S11e02982g1_1 [Rhodosporidium toruloides] n=2 Tax=Rhodotorula toruloides TaxID=5286 RepID=A0A0K3CF37_RHOTO